MLIDYGYKESQTSEVMSYSRALKTMLFFDKHYSRIQKRGKDFVFSYEAIRCPLCGAVIKDAVQYPEKHIHLNRVEDFFKPQLALATDTADDELLLSKANFSDLSQTACAYCKQTIYASDEKRNVHLESDANSAKVRLEIKNIHEFLSAAQLFDKDISITMYGDGSYGYEELRLDARSGKTYLSLLDAKGTLLARTDMTQAQEVDDICFLLFSSNAEIKAFLLNYLKQFREGKFPYKTLPDVYTAIELNRFQGFAREFYCAIPYKKNSREIESGFLSVCSHMHSAEQFISYAKKLPIYAKRGVRKQLFENQWCFFYLDELNLLYTIIRNEDTFCNLFYLVSRSTFFSLLMNLKLFPQSACFWKDLAAYHRGELVKLLEDYGENLLSFSNSYALLTDEMREKVVNGGLLKSIRKLNREEALFYEHHLSYRLFTDSSTPLFHQNFTLEDEVDGYTFTFLNHTNDSLTAGRRLNNCLKEWDFNDNPVMVIRNGVHIVAAIELEKYLHTIRQVRLKNNESIIKDYTLMFVFEKWRKKHTLFFDGGAMDVDKYFETLFGESAYDLYERNYGEDEIINARVETYYQQLYNELIKKQEAV